MVKARRYRMGSQMHVAMYFVLLINMALYSAGIRWLAYPADILAIVLVCLCIDAFRFAITEGYPLAKPTKKTRSLIYTAGALAIILCSIIPRSMDDHSLRILLYILSPLSPALLITIAVKSVLSKRIKDSI